MLAPKEIAELAVKTLDSKKAYEIKLLEMKKISSIADYFVICTAGSTTQIKTLADEVEKVLTEHGEAPIHTEGYRQGGWVLVDFGCVVVHLFMKEMRDFYSLERLWSDAEECDISALLTE